MMNKNFLVIGDVMLDRYVYGKTSIAPEAVIDFRFDESTKEVWKVGGAGNVVAQLSMVGGGDMLTAIGDDLNGQCLSRLLAGFPFNLHRFAAPKTTTKIRYVDRADDKILFRVSDEQKYWVEPEEFSTQLSRLKDENPEIIVISDYDKGLLNVTNISLLRQAFDETPIVVNPKFANVKYYQGVDCLVVNHLEAGAVLGRNGYGKKEALVKDLYDAIDVDCLIVTFGREGAFCQMGSGQCDFPTIEREVVDATGAGDTFFSVVAMLWKVLPLEKIIEVANRVAGASVGYVGNYVSTKKEIEQSLREER